MPVAPSRPCAREPRLSSEQCARVLSYLEAHFTEQIRLKDLATLIHVSAGHFCRAFKGSFGEQPRLYLMHRRMEHAKELMLLGDLPLSQVAVACGMVDQAHFCHTFRRVTGQTPGAWRRQNATGPVDGRLMVYLHSLRDPGSLPDPSPTQGLPPR